MKQRFEREAQTIAALNHPHICTLFDVGRQDGMDYLVIEYLDGTFIPSLPGWNPGGGAFPRAVKVVYTTDDEAVPR